MNESIENLADKYFNDQCTPGEAEKVLQWLDTEEGEQYLNEKIETDFDLIEHEKTREISQIAGLNSKKLFSSLLHRLERYGLALHQRPVYMDRKRFFQAAAGILIALTASLFYFFIMDTEVTEPGKHPVHVSTSSEEQRNIQLGDGTEIRLNSNSRLTISADYMNGSREVTLRGEAFFNVAHQAEAPFLIYTDLARVEVLGTSFNVKSSEEPSLVEVSVIEGRVFFEGKGDEQQRSITLAKGDYAYWDDDLKELNTEQFGAENYLAWMTGELVFEQLPMSNVCVQLQRFYEITCRFETDGIQHLGLNANIPNPGLENTLSVIALSLNLEYKRENGLVVWSVANSSEMN